MIDIISSYSTSYPQYSWDQMHLVTYHWDNRSAIMDYLHACGLASQLDYQSFLVSHYDRNTHLVMAFVNPDPNLISELKLRFS